MTSTDAPRGLDTVAPPPDPDATGHPRAGAAALAGLVAAGSALGVVSLLGRAVGDARPLDVSVGDEVIDRSPGWLVHWAIDVFGTNDKPALRTGIVVTALVLGAVAGLVAARVRIAGPVAFALAALAGIGAAHRDPQSDLAPAVLAAAAGTLVGAWALDRMLARAPRRPEATSSAPTDRRGFLRLVGGVAVVSAGATWLGQVWRRESKADAAIAALDLEVEPAAVPAAASFPVRGLTPLVTPNGDFYRIDTALLVPDIDPATWSLRVDGMVGAPFELSFDELLALPSVEHWTTLSCVSNEVGGRLVGNAQWLGVPLVDLLERADVDPAATQIVGHSIDRFTVGFPTSVAFDGRMAMVAYGMNGEPLPRPHGFPARLVVPGLYGYVSATKWLTRIELTTWDGFDAYWVPRGWSKEGPVKTQSRIDVPRGSVATGDVAVAGVAWAPHRGISRVEVQVDDGPWHEAELADALDDDTWRQWRWIWSAPPGDHVVRVRATDGDGEVQTAESARPAPSGATGWHSVVVRVR
jgi:DMSO/TMAO reductase YedYZ molybdopterin-dependent catalytic subunit